MQSLSPRVLFLGEVNYLDSYAWMQAFTGCRDVSTKDEFWVLSHPPVYTQGTSCEAIPDPKGGNIPVVKSDRGGQISYHGPGQLVIYLLLDIRRLRIGPKSLVRRIEEAIKILLSEYAIQGKTNKGAPGIYVDGEKIAALGLRIKNGCCYHGLSLNIDMDLSPFNAIDPCGYAGLKVTQIADFGGKKPFSRIANQLVDCLIDSIYASTD